MRRDKKGPLPVHNQVREGWFIHVTEEGMELLRIQTANEGRYFFPLVAQYSNEANKMMHVATEIQLGRDEDGKYFHKRTGRTMRGSIQELRNLMQARGKVRVSIRLTDEKEFWW